MTRRLTEREKLGRKPALRACTFCHSKHLQCSNTRPCQNCTKRKIEHECQDVTRKKASYMSSSDEKRRRVSKSRSVEDQTDGVKSESIGSDASHNSSITTSYDASHILGKRKTIHPPFTPEMSFPVPSQAMESAPTSLDTFHDQGHDTQNSTPSTTANFHSMFLNQEYMMLGDLISKPSSPSLDFAAPAPDPVMANNTDFFGPLDADGADTRPYISLGDGEGRSARENGFNFDLRPQDDLEYVSPLLSHHIYQTVQDIYSNRIIGFDYPSSYHSLTHFLKKRFSVTDTNISAAEKNRRRSNLLVILKLIASYRPAFISAHKSLFMPFDFQFLEMSFQRCLLDFENLSRLNASPMIVWRRTGEIVSMSAHLADILGMSSADVLSKRTFIMELMYDDESIVDYFRLFKSVAIGSLHSTIFTKCKLIKKHSQPTLSTSKTNSRLGNADFIEFCSVWTVKRDLFDLPMMIVGHFLPSFPNNDSFRSY